MIQRCSQFGMLALLMLALPYAACAAVTPSVVRGVVRTPDGVPQLGALVQLMAPDATAVATAITDMQGRYRIRGVASGRYKMRASAAMFLPVLRPLNLASGGQATVNLTLNALIMGQWLPSTKRRDPDNADDDWKWTLRSAENRPVLRILGEDIAYSHERPRRPMLSGRRVIVRGGTGSFASGGIHTVVLADHAGATGSATMMRADVGSGDGASLDVSTGYEHHMGYSGEVRMAAVYQNRPEIAFADGNGISAISMLQAERLQFGDLFQLEAGGLMHIVRAGSTDAAQALPFVSVSAEPAPGLTVSYHYATAHALQGYADMDSLRLPPPVATMQQGQMLLERGSHHELAVSKKIGAGSVRASVYADRLQHPVVSGIGVPETKTMQSAAVVVDSMTNTFRMLGPDYDARGVSITVSEPISDSLWLAAEYDNGAALVGDAKSSLHSVWAQAASVSLEGNWSGGTRVRASYRWQPDATVTAVNSYRRDAPDAFFSISLRRPLHCGRILPNGLEAVLDIGNLMAQGYRPVAVSADGGTLYLAQTARTVQAGLAFSF